MRRWSQLGMGAATLVAAACLACTPRADEAAAAPAPAAEPATAGAPKTEAPPSEPAAEPAEPEPPVVGAITGHTCEAEGLDQEDVHQRMAALVPGLQRCFWRAAAADESFVTSKVMVDVHPDPDGLPIGHNVAGDFTSDAAFDAFIPCASKVADTARLSANEADQPRATCHFTWKRDAEPQPR